MDGLPELFPELLEYPHVWVLFILLFLQLLKAVLYGFRDTTQAATR
jgi:hypothetical protein